MSRSRINGNFIDKTFSIVANILLRIIPTTSGEKNPTKSSCTVQNNIKTDSIHKKKDRPVIQVVLIQ